MARPLSEAPRRMEERVDAIRDENAPELVWLLEHPPLYTAGTSAAPDELLDPGALPVYATGRGGRYTYHGPGQRVVYVMLDLEAVAAATCAAMCGGSRSLSIRTLAGFGVNGERRDGRIGIWVATGGGEAKVAAIGVRVRHWVTSHGLALNVDPELSHFAGIVPCGIREHGVTSLRALGVPVGMAEVDPPCGDTSMRYSPADLRPSRAAVRVSSRAPWRRLTLAVGISAPCGRAQPSPTAAIRLRPASIGDDASWTNSTSRQSILPVQRSAILR